MLEILFPKAQEKFKQAQKILEKSPLYKETYPKICELQKYPESFKISDGAVEVQSSGDYKEIAKKLIPWRKGPFKVGTEFIDSEWRSDFKWDRLKDFVDLKNKVVLDIGCNNGYYMFQMLAQEPKFILGIDPVPRVQMQFKFIQQMAATSNIEMSGLGVDDLDVFKNSFDLIFSMGILYHHRNPIKQLVDMREALRPKGELILETIAIPGDELNCICPEESYARMKNVWFIPTRACLHNWLKRSKFSQIEEVSFVKLGLQEQRSSKYCPALDFKTLEDSLNPNNHDTTIEGYPAPYRIIIKAKKKG